MQEFLPLCGALRAAARRLLPAALTGAFLAAGVGGAHAQKVTDPGTVPADLVAAAKKEGTVVFYGGTDENTLQEVAEAFQKRYGVKVQFQRLPSGPQRERIEQEAKAGKTAFDVSQLSDEAWVAEAAGRNMWLKLDPKRMPNLARVPANLQNDYYAVGGLVALTMIYNTKRLAAGDVPKTMEEVLNPKFAGRFAMVGPTTGLSVRTGYYLLLQKFGQAGYEKYMRDLFALKPRVLASGANGTQQVAAGELDFVLFASAAFAAEPRAQGAPVAVAYPDPTGITVRTFQVAAKPLNPNAAQLFLNWLMSPEGLQLMDGKEQAAPPYGKIPTALELPATAKLPKPTDVMKSSDFILKNFAAVSK